MLWALVDVQHGGGRLGARRVVAHIAHREIELVCGIHRVSLIAPGRRNAGKGDAMGPVGIEPMTYRL
jgi:hypothetical protein